MPEYWILRGRIPVPTSDPQEWAQFFENVDARRVRRTQLGPNIVVSTVFLGLDHSFGRGGPPLLFETMSFRDEAEDGCWRCSTWDEAEAQHAAVVEALRQSTGFQPMSAEEFRGIVEKSKRVTQKENPTVWQHLLDEDD